MNPVSLPTVKAKRSIAPETAKVVVYGAPKIGKTTLAANWDPDHVLILATEPGTSGLEAFVKPIGSWEEFRATGGALAQTEHQFKTVVVDTVDVLYKYCTDFVMGQLGIQHPSDAAYGKGWAAVRDEFQLRIAKLGATGMGVWFISHAQFRDIELRIGKLTKAVPTMSGQGWEFISGWCDFILYATAMQNEEGETRVLRTQAAENYEAGGRLHLPDPLPLNADALRAAIKQATQPERSKNGS